MLLLEVRAFSRAIDQSNVKAPARKVESKRFPKHHTAKPVYNGSAFNGHRTTSRKSCLIFTVKFTCI